MKRIFISLFIVVLLINLSFLVQAQEASKYNFGSAQAAKELNTNPGGELATKLYFYNIYGNRITHIILEVNEKPENWVVSLTPNVHETGVDISGVITTINENLYVEPSQAVDKIPAIMPEGIEYISSKVGYIGAKPVEIKIKVPENEKYESYNLNIVATAFWLGQQGTTEVQQSRDFEYKINVVSGIFYEKPIEEPEVKNETEKAPETVKNETEKAPETPGLVGITGGVIGVREIATGILTLTTIILIILILILLFLWQKRQK